MRDPVVRAIRRALGPGQTVVRTDGWMFDFQDSPKRKPLEKLAALGFGKVAADVERMPERDTEGIVGVFISVRDAEYRDALSKRGYAEAWNGNKRTVFRVPARTK